MTEPKIFCTRITLGFLGLAIALGVVALINPILACKGYIRPESVDTPPLLSLPRDKWPEHGLDAVERGLPWGQCKSCGFPVTSEDILYGFGVTVRASSPGKIVINEAVGVYIWEEFYCYRHTELIYEFN